MGKCIHSHKQVLKAVKQYKHKNYSKEKNDKKFGNIGTGTREFSHYLHHNYLEAKYIQECCPDENMEILDNRNVSKIISFEKYLSNEHECINGNKIVPDRWSLAHNHQIMESNIHDRTRWESNIRKDKNRKKDREFKL